MLAIRIDYLTDVYMATRYDAPRRSAGEWPPHPDRLFSALVAAAADLIEGEGPELTKPSFSALQWLCGLDDPQLAVSEASPRFAADVHMPTNPHVDEIPAGDLDSGDRSTQGKKRAAVLGLLPVFRKKAALPIPAVIPDDPVAYFIWPGADGEKHLEVLRAICQRVTCLGRSRSLVRALVVDDPPSPTHESDSLGQIQLRVPGKGRLDYLVDKYRRDGGKPSPSQIKRYRRSGSDRSPDEPSTVFDRFWAFQPGSGDRPLPAVSTLKVTQALRTALIACIEEDQRSRGDHASVPDIVHGHGRHPHCAYVALPFIHPLQRFADGSIKGVAVLIPRGVDDGALRNIARGLVRIERNGLGVPGNGTWWLHEVAADDPPSDSVDPQTWGGPSAVWATATPMVFGHFPKPNKGGEVKVILDSLGMIGIEPERVLEIAVGRYSPLYGAPPSWHFKPRRSSIGIEQRPAWIRHVTICFDRPVRGPIVLGSMRYFGLGLMRPIKE
jgi:CRISPR-associated protein Csb2